MNITRQQWRDKWRVSPVLSVLFVCFMGVATGAFALKADGFASQNGGTTEVPEARW